LCESKVYVRNEEADRLVMEDAVLLESGQGRVKITDVLGEENELEGDVEEISFLDHRIVIRER
jgi:predicted RNA-binding protein